MASMKSLWSAPESVLEQLKFKGGDQEWRDFLLCGFYCSVAVFFLLIFGVAALLREETAYATVILGFAAATCMIYGGIYLSRQFHLARHFVVTLMGTLCLFLFHSGGTESTGPIYYFIFPIVAVFLQGVRTGSISLVILLIATLFIHESALLGYDPERYSFVFMSRIFAVFTIISILAFLFAWFREKAERDLLLSREDLEHIIHVDSLTGLCNRSFMEQLMQLEYNRYQRYQAPFCLMAIKVDDMERIRKRFGTENNNTILQRLAQLLEKALRNVDIPARWDTDLLLAMMPQSSLDSAGQMAERVRQFIRKETFRVGTITVSIGISQVEDKLDAAITQAEENLRLASQGNGNKVVAGKQQNVQEQASGLDTYFKE